MKDALLSDNAKLREIRAEMERAFDTVQDDQTKKSVTLADTSDETGDSESKSEEESKQKEEIRSLEKKLDKCKLKKLRGLFTREGHSLLLWPF